MRVRGSGADSTTVALGWLSRPARSPAYRGLPQGLLWWRRVDQLDIPVQAGEAAREGARIHTSTPARSRIRWFQKCGSRRPGPDAALRHGLLWWRVDELGLPAGGHPVYAMNGIERGLALSSLLGSYWLPSAPDPGSQRISRRAGSCSVPARERGPIVCIGFGGPADQSPPPPPPRPQERPQERRLPS